MKFFLGLVEFSSKSLPCHSEGPSLRAHTHAHARTHTHTPHTHTHTTPVPLEPQLRSSELGGREEGAICLGKEPGFVHCDWINVILLLCLWDLRPLRPEGIIYL